MKMKVNGEKVKLKLEKGENGNSITLKLYEWDGADKIYDSTGYYLLDFISDGTVKKIASLPDDLPFHTTKNGYLKISRDPIVLIVSNLTVRPV